jgi:hypothetical protein
MTATRRFRRLFDPDFSVTPWYGLLAAIITLASWVVSTGFEKRSNDFAQRVSAAITQYEADDRFNYLVLKLDNLEKANLRIENGVAGGRQNLDSTKPISENDILRQEFISEADRWRVNENLLADIYATYKQDQQLGAYATDMEIPACPKVNVVSYAPVDCLDRVGLDDDASLPVTELREKLQSFKAQYPSSDCLADQVAAARARFNAINESAIAASSILRAYLEKADLQTVAIDPPNYDKMRRSIPIRRFANRYMATCIANDTYSIRNEVRRAAQRVLAYGKNEVLPARQLAATVIGWLAIVLYILAAAFGIAAKYVEINAKRAPTAEAVAGQAESAN